MLSKKLLQQKATIFFSLFDGEIPDASQHALPCLSYTVLENEQGLALQGSFRQMSLYVTCTTRIGEPDERSLIYEKSGQALSVVPSTHNCQKQRKPNDRGVGCRYFHNGCKCTQMHTCSHTTFSIAGMVTLRLYSTSTTEHQRAKNNVSLGQQIWKYINFRTIVFKPNIF